MTSSHFSFIEVIIQVCCMVSRLCETLQHSMAAFDPTRPINPIGVFKRSKIKPDRSEVMIERGGLLWRIENEVRYRNKLFVEALELEVLIVTLSGGRCLASETLQNFELVSALRCRE